MSAFLEMISEQLPVRPTTVPGLVKGNGLVIVDEVNGFATVGAGNLAPPQPNSQVTRMVTETDRLARAFAAENLPIAAFLDTHDPGKPEPPYPPHCERGTGEEKLVPELAWLEDCPQATLIAKDCINGFVGAIQPDGRNQILEWVLANDVSTMIVVGICTDICVMDFVLTTLSARNHGMAGGLRDIVVYEPGCATYDLPKSVAVDTLGLPETAAHPQAPTHHLGLYFMASRGAVIADRLD
jgi:nicotinamidase-related amidase